MSIATLEREEEKELTYSSKMSTLKPKKSSQELVQQMKDKGIVLDSHTEDYVEHYLLNNNNYLRLCSYRKNYQKHQKGENVGKYINLSFNQLKALSTLDMKLRKLIFSMCVDIEHSLKLKILNDFEVSNDDGYSIIQDFFKSNEYGEQVANNILRKHNSAYIKDLANKYIYPKETNDIYISKMMDYTTSIEIEYNLDIPIWVMVEMVTFGDLLHFYEFYYDKNRSGSLKMPIHYKILLSVKNIRNACAHNNCILNNLSEQDLNVQPKIGSFVSNLGFNRKSKRLQCKTIYEIMCVLFSLEELASFSVAKQNINELKSVFDDFNKEYLELFKKNDLILKSLYFLKKVVDKLYNSCYHITVIE